MSDEQIYQIRIRGHIGENWASWFDGLTLRRIESGDTIISGVIPDQAALHGILMIVRDLGLTLVEVKCLDCNNNA
jgi:hypothetical protein